MPGGALLGPLRAAGLALVGSAAALDALRSAVRTFILPRSASDPLTRAVFVGMRRPFDLRAGRVRSYERRDDLMALLIADADQAWRDFARVRGAYDGALPNPAALTMAPCAPWSSDRSLVERANGGV